MDPSQSNFKISIQFSAENIVQNWVRVEKEGDIYNFTHYRIINNKTIWDFDPSNQQFDPLLTRICNTIAREIFHSKKLQKTFSNLLKYSWKIVNFYLKESKMKVILDDLDSLEKLIKKLDITLNAFSSFENYKKEIWTLVEGAIFDRKNEEVRESISWYINQDPHYRGAQNKEELLIKYGNSQREATNKYWDSSNPDFYRKIFILLAKHQINQFYFEAWKTMKISQISMKGRTKHG